MSFLATQDADERAAATTPASSSSSSVSPIPSRSGSAVSNGDNSLHDGEPTVSGAMDAHYNFENSVSRIEHHPFPDTVTQLFGEGVAGGAGGGRPETGVKLIQQYYVLGFRRLPWLTESWDFRGQKRVYKLCGLDPFWPAVLLSFGTLWSSVLLAALVCAFFGCILLYTFKRDRLPLQLGDESDSDDMSSSEEDEYNSADQFYKPVAIHSGSVSSQNARMLGISSPRDSSGELGMLRSGAAGFSENKPAAAIEEEMMELFAF